jgi:hypothetical protein
MTTYQPSFVVLAFLALIGGCQSTAKPGRGFTTPVPGKQDAAAAVESATLSVSDADTPAPVVVAMTPLTSKIVAQVEHEDWGAFLPRVGTLATTAACVSLRDGSVTPNTAVRVCSSAELKARAGYLLQDLSRDLKEHNGMRTGGWSCTATECTIHAGEMGINATLSLAHVGATVALLGVEETCGGALTEDTLKELAREKPAKVPPQCKPSK